MSSEMLLAAAIAAVFIVPALILPNVGRGMLAALFLGGSVFNLLYTLPNAPQSLLDLVSTAPIPLYREVIGYVVAWNAATAFILSIAVFELVTGLLILWRGNLARLALLGAGAWCLGMLPVIPPEAIVVGAALTGTPGVAALLLARRRYGGSLPSIAPAHLHKPTAPHPASVR
jgi:hypothetical protein